MDEKISLEAIARYADVYSEKVIKAFFQNKQRISGSEILNFSNVPQVNFFIVKELFTSWKEETKKLRSPYFNYDSEEVKEALEVLMNALSQNIAITQPDFAPLVKTAVSQSLLVIFDPYDYYSMLITADGDSLHTAILREEIKYLKVNKAPLERMLQRLDERNLSQVSQNEALSILDQILEEVNFTPEDVEGYIERFSIVSPLDPNTFFISMNRSPEPVREEPEPPKKNVVAEPRPMPISPPATEAKPNINEKHLKEPRPTLADNFQRRKKIKESLTINQKFMFTKVLFHGDFELFSRAVDRLDQFDSLPAALKYIEEEHASTWDRDSEEFHEFMELLENRFA